MQRRSPAARALAASGLCLASAAAGIGLWELRRARRSRRRRAFAPARPPPVARERARAIYQTLQRDADVPIEFAANIGLLLLGVRRVVQLDAGFYPELGDDDPRAAPTPRLGRTPSLWKSQVASILAHCEGELVVADTSAAGDVTLAHRDDPWLGGGDEGGAALDSAAKNAFGACLDEVYSVCAWVDGMSARAGLHQIYFNVIDASGLHYGRYELGPIIVLMCDSPSLRAGFDRVYDRFEYFRSALLELDPELQMELRVYSKPENERAWRAQPTLKAAALQNIGNAHRPQTTRHADQGAAAAGPGKPPPPAPWSGKVAPVRFAPASPRTASSRDAGSTTALEAWAHQPDFDEHAASGGGSGGAQERAMSELNAPESPMEPRST